MMEENRLTKILRKIEETLSYNPRIREVLKTMLRSPFILKNPIYLSVINFFIKSKAKRLARLPSRVAIENTNICNAKPACIFCPHGKMGRKEGIMNYDLFKHIIDECSSLGVSLVPIGGLGEPLVDPEYSNKVKYAKLRGIKKVITTTNGSLLTEEKSQGIIKCGLDELHISIDAATEETYKKLHPGLSFFKLEKGISSLIKLRDESNQRKPKIILSYLLLNLNYAELNTFILKWRDRVENILIKECPSSFGGGVENIHNLSNIYPKGTRIPCKQIWAEMVISWDGKVPLCYNDYDNRIILGDIKKESINQIWHSKLLEKLREYHIKKEFEKILICKSCTQNFSDNRAWVYEYFSEILR